MELQQIGLSTMIVLSDTSKSVFVRSSEHIQLPATVFFDSLIPISSLPPTTQWRTVSSLIFISSEGSKLVESAYQENQAIKSFDDSGETVYFVYFSHEPSLQTFLLAKYSLFELCSDFLSYQTEINHLALNRVKDIKFKVALKDCLNSYKSYFEQWVETVNTQQKEIQKLSEELSEHKEKQETFNETTSEVVSLCIICEKERRNIVFVPCGHVAVCTYCLNIRMKLRPNDASPQKKTQQKCVICKKSIKVAHEVYF